MSSRTNDSHPLQTFVNNPVGDETLPDVENTFQYTKLLEEYYPCKIKYPKKLYSQIPTEWVPQDGVWKDLLVPVTDQGTCGSCWAFSVVNTLSDRYNIWCRKKIFETNLSPFLILSCNLFATFLTTQNLVKNIDFQTWNKENGCYGNILLGSILYIYFFGIPKSDCFPYAEGDILKFQQEKTNFSFFSPTNSNIHLKNHTFNLKDFQNVKLTPSCAYATNSQSPPFGFCLDNIMVEKSKLYGSISQNFSITHFYSIENDEKQIQLEILANGPVVSGFIVYGDYYTFDPKKDIYIHNKKLFPNIVGGHAIEIVGWGEENGVKYWWIKNTWGTEYGVNGYFRFLRGENMCHIESNVHGFFPDLYVDYFNFKKIKTYRNWIKKYKYVYDSTTHKLVSLVYKVLLFYYTTQQSYYKDFKEEEKDTFNVQSYFDKYGSFGYPVFLRTNSIFLLYTNNFLQSRSLINTSFLTDVIHPYLPTKAYRKTFYANFKEKKMNHNTKIKKTQDKKNVFMFVCFVVILLIIIFLMLSRKN